MVRDTGFEYVGFKDRNLLFDPMCPATIKNGFWRQLEMTPDDN
jgi:hypothetical protein